MRIHVNRQLMGVDDIVWGTGTVEQTRNGQAVLISKVSAIDIPFTNTVSGLAATTVEEAIDEVEDRVDTAETKLDLVTITQPVDLDAIETKIDLVTVTQPVDLDAIEDTQANQTLAIGNINKPLLHLPLDNSLDFEKGVGTVSFTRATTGTYIDRYGVLKTALTDEPRFEKDGLLVEGASTNLILYSEDFNQSSWLKTRVSVLPNSTIAPDGTLTADSLIDSSTGDGTGYIYRTGSFTIGTQYCFSLYVKKIDGISGAKVRIQLSSAYGFNVNYPICDFDFDTEAVTLGRSYNVESLSDGWFRLSVYGESEASYSGNIIYFSHQGSDTEGNGFYIWGAQLEKLPFASSYIPSTDTFTSRATTGTYYNASGTLSTSAINEARYTYNPSDLTAPASLLLEGASTNLMLQSEDPSLWPKTLLTYNSTSVENGVTYGTFTPDVGAGAGGTDGLLLSTSGSLLVGDEITLSFRIKYTSIQYISLRRNSTFNDPLFLAKIDLVNKTIVTDDSLYGLTLLVNEDDSITVSGTFSVNTGTGSQIGYFLQNTFSGDADGINTLKVGMPQTEKLPYATSYIPTTGTTVTRSADVSTSVATTRAGESCSVTAKDNTPSLLSDSQFSYAFDYDCYGDKDSGLYFTMLDFNNGVIDNFRTMVYVASGLRLASDTSGLPSTVINTDVVAYQKYRVVFTADNLAYSTYLDGLQTISSIATNSFLASQVQRIDIGTTSGNQFQHYGHISNLRIYDKTLSAEEARLA